MNEILEKSTGDESLNQVIQLNAVNYQRKDQKELIKSSNSQSTISSSYIQEMLELKDSINLSDTESLLTYITNLTLKTLLSSLLDMSLIGNHKYIIEDLKSIVETIRVKISPYLHIIVPCLAHYMNHCGSDLNSDIFTLFTVTVNACQVKFGEESQRNVDILVDVIFTNLFEKKWMDYCLQTLKALITTSRLVANYR